MIVAVDFDGVLCDNEFPNIGAPHNRIIAQVKELIDRGHEVVLWTSRVDEPLERAVEWCEAAGMHFCAVNDGAPSTKRSCTGCTRQARGRYMRMCTSTTTT